MIKKIFKGILGLLLLTCFGGCLVIGSLEAEEQEQELKQMQIDSQRDLELGAMQYEKTMAELDRIMARGAK